MKNVKLFLEYNSDIESELNRILDKISDSGIDSLTNIEKEFLDSQNKDKKDIDTAFNKLKELDIEIEDDINPFTFKLKEIKRNDSTTELYGIMSLPKIEFDENSNNIIDGDSIEGFITLYNNGSISTHFDKNEYTDFDFVQGLEYEYDSFIENIIYELENEYNVL